MRANFEPTMSNMRNFTSPYKFREYPKHVTLADGSYVVVNNPEEEAAAIGEESAGEGGTEALRDALMAEARALGLNPHHRSGIDKLREMIAGAKG
ncbi:hypothetical protein UA18_03447 [Burkholderia multivorans]|uniref:Uncharacterized protein n=3 Tax=Burkholderia TaxID=32008 RepID=A4JD32_BURVG|nr:hypothetical protein Bcep1808_1174 [Burkholderia vietnamiensis G4]SAJ96546.1 hypothetical protein UA18_03447 [Burkholderia multivorans]